jgi:DNA-directed RNA polymerase subunit omega
MAEPRSTMIDPPIESLLDKVDSKFTLVTLASKRARQINSYFNQLGEGLGAIVPPQVTSVARKPLSIALEEISAGKVRAGDPIDESVDDAVEVLVDGEPTVHALVQVPAGEDITEEVAALATEDTASEDTASEDAASEADSDPAE